MPVPGTTAAAAGAVRLRDVALVREVEDMQTGLADMAGVRAVGGIVIARRDADIGTLVDEVKRVVAREARKLPHRAADPERLDSGVAADVHVSTAYDRSDVATRVRKTLLRALGEEVGVVVLVILLFLLHGRSALVPLATLPVVLLLTFGAMWALGVPATIMSLGGIGIALGMAVDAESWPWRPLTAARDAGATRVPRGAPREAARRGPVVRAGDPDLARDHGAVVPPCSRSRARRAGCCARSR